MVARLNVRLLNGLSCFEPRGGGGTPYPRRSGYVSPKEVSFSGLRYMKG